MPCNFIRNQRKSWLLYFQDKFSINPKTGAIKTVKGLDFELARSHMLIVGTEEGRAGGKAILWLFVYLNHGALKVSHCPAR